MSEQKLKRVFGKSFAAFACIGLVIGLGILRTPGEVASSITDPYIYIALWVGGAVVVLLSLNVVGELISMTPVSGGEYVLVHRAFGSFPAFVIGWSSWLGQCGSTALKAVVMMEYLALLMPFAAPYSIAGAIAVTSFFALLQISGSLWPGRLLSVASTLSAIVVLAVAVALFYGAAAFVPGAAIETTVAPGGLQDFALIVAAIVFTYDGWYAASYINGETKGDTRASVMASFKGVSIVIFIYLLVNAALAFTVPFGVIQGQDLALASALEYSFGSGAGAFIIGFAVVLLLSNQNLGYMFGARGLYALSVNGVGYDGAQKVNERGAPSVAVALSWGLVVVLIISGGFRFLLTLTAMIFMVNYIVFMAGVLWLRRKEPNAERPFRSVGYPIVAVVMTFFWLALAVFLATVETTSTLYALGFLAFAVPVYIWLRRNVPASSSRMKAGF